MSDMKIDQGKLAKLVSSILEEERERIVKNAIAKESRKLKVVVDAEVSRQASLYVNSHAFKKDIANGVRDWIGGGVAESLGDHLPSGFESKISRILANKLLKAWR